jgi:hypothetical protein
MFAVPVLFVNILTRDAPDNPAFFISGQFEDLPVPITILIHNSNIMVCFKFGKRNFCYICLLVEIKIRPDIRYLAFILARYPAGRTSCKISIGTAGSSL